MNMQPIIIVNFKTYEQATGEHAITLAKALESISKDVIVAVQNADIYRVAHETSLKVYAQHVDPVTFGANTGKDLPECLKSNGAQGVLINHSEDSVDYKTVNTCIKRAKEIGLETVVCIPKVEDLEKVKNADMIAFEDPELIGSGRAISKMMPEKVKEFANYCTQAIPLCGAGITSKEDVVAALELGIKGILVSSAIVNVSNPEIVLKQWLEGL